MKFSEYVLRVTDGRLHVGRTPLPVFVGLQLAAVVMILGGSGLFGAEGWPITAAFGLAITVILWAGTVANFKVDKALAERPSSNNHYRDVCEGCDPVRMADGSPITDIVKWYAATRGVTREEAKSTLDGMPDHDLLAVQQEHAEYLDGL